VGSGARGATAVSNSRSSWSAAIDTTGGPTVSAAHAAASVIHAGRAPVVPSGSSQNSTALVRRGTVRLTRAIWPYRGCHR
jgi:hypothetical protein